MKVKYSHSVLSRRPGERYAVQHFRDKGMALAYAKSERRTGREAVYRKTKHGSFMHYKPEDWAFSQRLGLKRARMVARRTRARRSR